MFGFGKTFENYIKYLSNDETEKVLDLLDSSEKVFGDPLVLHYACYYKNYEVIKFLLSKSKSPYAINDQGYSPLHYLTNMGEIGKLHRSKDPTIVHTDFGRSAKTLDSFDSKILDLFKNYRNIFYIQNESIINLHYLHYPIDLSFAYNDLDTIKYFFKLGVDLKKLCKKRNENGTAKKFDKNISEGVNLYFGILMVNSRLGLYGDKDDWPMIAKIHRLLIKKGYKFNINKSISYCWDLELSKKETDKLINDYKNLIKNY